MERIGRYKIVRLLGEGGFAQVYLGIDEELEREVAIKAPHARIYFQNGNAQSFIKEARALTKLEHPSIVPILHLEELDDGRRCAVTKYIAGGSLRDKMKTGRLPLELAVRIIVTIADALDHAHRKGWVHRDIKPGNILIGLDDKPYLADFGLAVELATKIASPEKSYGTLLYMAPEQAQPGAERLDAQTDIWAIGVVLYELIVGRRPFDKHLASADKQGIDIDGVRQAIVGLAPKPPRSFDKSIPVAIERTCLKALQKEKRHRHGSAAELAQELRSSMTTLFAKQTLQAAQTHEDELVDDPSSEAPSTLPPGVEEGAAWLDDTKTQVDPSLLAWLDRLSAARRQGRLPDVLTLADELTSADGAPFAKISAEAHFAVADALKDFGVFDMALNHCEKALWIEPHHLPARHIKGVALERLSRGGDSALREQARNWLQGILTDHPHDAETWALLGRIEKDVWREAPRRYDRLEAAIDAYATGFLKDPRSFFAGINVVSLSHILMSLTGKSSLGLLQSHIEDGVRRAIEAALASDSDDFWAMASLAELETLAGDPGEGPRRYQEAAALADGRWFYLDSARQQLQMLCELDIRPGETSAGLRVLEGALSRLPTPED